jgi:HupE / UreJ protein
VHRPKLRPLNQLVVNFEQHSHLLMRDLPFGLIHGLGFAGGLSDAGLPVLHIPTALLFFSLGVESGHFLFIGVVMSLIALARRTNLPVPQSAELVPPYAIGAVAMFWVIQRMAVL